MKNLLLNVLGVFMVLTISAQPPQMNRPLPNQFRDFVDHQQRWNMERPKIEKKDGKVIITMSEDQFKRMQMMRHRPPMVMTRFQQPNSCRRCEFNNRRRKNPL